jgi:hypothetical protein
LLQNHSVAHRVSSSLARPSPLTEET